MTVDVGAVGRGGPLSHGAQPAVGAWARLRRRPSFVAALVVVLLVVVLAVLAPLLVQIWGHAPDEQFRETGLSPRGLPTGPGAEFWLGADHQGRDVLSRLLYGARVSLFVGVVATLVATVVGTAVGLLSGYAGGWTDALLSRTVDVVLSLPSLLLAMAVVAVVGASLWVTVAVLAFFSWAWIARVVRALTRSLRTAAFVEASRVLGASRTRVLLVDLLPNVAGTVLAYATLLLPAMIIAEATLSFLGLGVQPPMASWGTMLADAENGRRYLVAPWLLAAPSVAILGTALAVNVLGDRLREALDPDGVALPARRARRSPAGRAR